jgi:hypothetical protein
MDRLMPTDELNTLRMKLDADFRGSVEQRRQRKEERIDEILELLILAYMYGNEAGNDMLFGSDFIESLGFTFGGTEQGAPDQPNRVIDIDPDSMNEAVFRKIADKDWRQRVSEYFDAENGTADDVFRVVDTDTHRVYNDAILNVGERADGRIYKTWKTMSDPRVREPHQFLEGMTIPIDKRFYSYNGQSARYPGDFGTPEMDCNCRCRIELTRQ